MGLAEEEEARVAAKRRAEREEVEMMSAPEELVKRRERELITQLAETEAVEQRRQEREQRGGLAAEEKERKRAEKDEKDRVAAVETEKIQLERATKERRAKEDTLLDRLSRKHLYSLPMNANDDDDEDWETVYDNPTALDYDGGRCNPSPYPTNPGPTMTVIYAALEAAFSAKMSRHTALAEAGLEHMSHLDDHEVENDLDFEDV